MELIARGRDADVYALDESRVLRRYRHGGGSTELEARLMGHLSSCGYPVPQVHGAGGTDMVLERLTGPTMLDVMARRPWQVRPLGRLLGGLHDRLHALPAPEWLPRRFSTAQDPEGDRVLHLDLHPANVMLTPRGPMVIDWCNARAGDPGADLAMTLVTIGSAEAPGAVARLGRGLLLRAIRDGSRTDPGRWMQEAITAKLSDPNLKPAEAARLRARAESASAF